MATNASVDAVSTESSKNEKTIIISDPVKVTINVVQGTGGGKSAEHTSGLSSTIGKIVDSLTAPQDGRSSAEQSITINDPVKVTITVVQATHDEKKDEQPLSSAVKETTVDTSKVEASPSTQVDDPVTVPSSQPVDASTVETLQSTRVEDPVTVPSSQPVDASTVETLQSTRVEDPVTVPTSQPVERQASVPSPTPATNDKTADRSPDGLEKQESTSSVTSSPPAANEQGTLIEKITTVTTTTEEKKDSAPALESTPSASQTPTPTEEKKESTPVLTTTTTTTDVTDEDKSKNEGSSSTSEDSKKTETKETSSTSSESKTNAGEDTKRQESTPQQSTSSDSTKEDSTTLLSSSTVNKGSEKETPANFPITKGNSKHLTDFQRKKAEYFFNANLDIENKKFLTWEDVEFYLLFHVTVAGKEGANGGDLEARLSRAARALWEHIFDQVPAADGKREKLSLEQFLDTWASLIDYIVKNGQLPTLVQDLVNLGFELYSSKGDDGKAASIPVSAFEQLFQKMNLGRPYALMAYKFLTENDTKPLDADKVNSIVRAVITSSDDGHPSHFLLPGFFKTISSKPTESQSGKGTPSPSPSPSQGADQSDKSGKTTPTPQPGGKTSPAPSQTSQVSKTEGKPTPSPPKPSPSPTNTQQPANPPQPPVNPSSGGGVVVQQPAVPLNPQQQKVFVQELDKNIRNLLRFYHIDDGDLVEVADGPAKRLVVVHPERPLPSYIQQNPGLVQQLQDSNKGLSIQSPPDQQTSVKPTESKTANTAPAAQETKPKVTLEERVARGEAQVGPTVPIRQGQQVNQATTAGVRQVFPPAGGEQRQESSPSPALKQSVPPTTAQEEPKKAPEAATNNSNQNQSTSPISAHEEPKKTPEAATNNSNQNQSTVQQGAESEKKLVTPEEEEQIVAKILEQLTPLVEELVAHEVHRIRRGLSAESDESHFLPFPFMFAGGPGSQGQSVNTGQGGNFGGIPGGGSFIPPELLMTMMNDLSRGNQGVDSSGFSGNGSRPPPGHPTGVEGFMMFVDADPIIGGPPRPGPRY